MNSISIDSNSVREVHLFTFCVTKMWNCVKRKYHTNSITRMIQQYKIQKKEYLNLSPREKWHFVRKIGVFFLTLTGVPHVLDPHQKINWSSCLSTIAGIDVFISFLYTIWYYFSNPIKACLFIPLLGIYVPVN